MKNEINVAKKELINLYLSIQINNQLEEVFHFIFNNLLLIIRLIKQRNLIIYSNKKKIFQIKVY